MEVNTIGCDLAKNVFQVAWRRCAWTGAVSKLFRSLESYSPGLSGWKPVGPAIIGPASRAEWVTRSSRCCPAYVKPYVKRGKTDAGDAAAICGAVTRPNMHFVAVKSVDQRAELSLHWTRDFLVRQRTQSVNMIRGLLAEFGIVMAKGVWNALKLAERIVKGECLELPPAARQSLMHLAEQAHALHSQIMDMDRKLQAWSRRDETAKRLQTIPGVGVLSSSALVSSLADPHQFRSGRQFTAWLGLTPLARSSGGKERMGRISKMSDGYIR